MTAPRKNKPRYSYLNDTVPIKNYLILENNTHRQAKNNSKEYPRKVSLLESERPKKSSWQAGQEYSVADLINEINGDKDNFESKINKNFPRIPIEYNDEKVNGVCTDGLRVKVVFKGYAPRNTYFFFKSLTSKKSFEPPIDLHSRVQIKKNETDLHFNSNFESGNLSLVIKKSEKEFYLYMREDTNTFGLRQWFFFSVANTKAGKYKFRIYKFNKPFSLYKNGMKPYFRCLGEEWRQRGDQVKYEYDMEEKCFYLEFEFEFENDNMVYECAAQPPYTYGMLKDYLKLLLEKYPKINVKKAGDSLAGLDIPKIEIVTPSEKKKKAIIVIGRTHPSETASNWTIESFIDRVYELPTLLDYYDFYVIPMVNPDGVFFGNHRTGLMGQDINRHFNSAELDFFPEVFAVEKLIQEVQKEKKIAFLFDLHGHSSRKNIFAYGDRHPVTSKAFVNLHILPKLISNEFSIFKYKQCVFRNWKNKKATARVYISNKYKINAITFEQSYGLIDEGVIGINHWRTFGISLANCLKKHYEMSLAGAQKLEEYLSPEIAYCNKVERKKEQEIFKQPEHKLEIQIQTLTESSAQENKSKLNFEKKGEVNVEIIEKSEKKQEILAEDNGSVKSEELSSGEESLENNDEGMEVLKKEIAIQRGFTKEITKRERYNVAQSNIEIEGHYFSEANEWKYTMIPMIPRILKLQIRKKSEDKYARSKSNKKISFSVGKKGNIFLPLIEKDKSRRD